MAAVPENLLDFDDVLLYTQSERVELVKEIKKQAMEMQDPKQQAVLLKALADMDKGVVSKRRLGIEEEAQKSSDEQARNVSDILRGIKSAMFQSAPGDQPRAAPTLDANTDIPVLVPGEIDQGVANMNYESFIKGLPNPDIQEVSS